jgi:TldD protein
LKRKDFIKLTGMGLGALAIPSYMLGSPVEASYLLNEGMNASTKKVLADAALNTAKSKGATYADVRISRHLNQNINTREARVLGINNGQSFGAGVRVLLNGTWGFAATNDVTIEGITRAAATAAAIAKANSKLQREPVKLAPQKGMGEQSWKSPIEINAFQVPEKDKVELLMKVNSQAMKAGASYINSSLFLVNEQKYFASTDGSYIDQDIHRIWPTFTVTVVDKQSGKFKTREAMSSPIQRGYEYLRPQVSEKIAGPADLVLYRNNYDMVEDAVQAAQQARAKHSAKSVKAGDYDLVLDPNHLGLTIHESVGHSTELDRVLGYEANYAGTSFATLDKWKTGRFNFGSDIVNIVADRKQPYFLNTVGYDDEGVPAKEWDLIRNGILVNYQATRDQVHILGKNESQGCSYADRWDHVQFQRMPNVSLKPGKEKLSVQDMIAGVEKGIYILGRGSYSIDHQRYNFQFGGQVFYEILNGKITGILDDVAYQSNTQYFWNSCAQICDAGDYRSFGSFFDGKGQPGQISAVSHGSSTARFNKINILNTNTAKFI